MSQIRKASFNGVKVVVEELRSQMTKGSLLDFARQIQGNADHALHAHFDSYDPIPFTITKDDVTEIHKYISNPETKKTWSPLEKLFFAALWKNDKVKGIRQIVAGLSDGNNSSTSGKGGLVFFQFGKHLFKPEDEPIVDQHTMRAYKLILATNDAELKKSRSLAAPTAEDIKEYVRWFNEIAKGVEQKRLIDMLLFALGRYSKLQKKKNRR